MNEPKSIPEKRPDKKRRGPEIEAPFVPEFEVPDPPVPNRAHTELSLGNFDPDALGNFDTNEND